MARYLLPFTNDVEMDILESLIRFAADQHAALIPLSLVLQPLRKHRGVRLELLQQSQDFLEAVRAKAARCAVPLEPVEVCTDDLVHSILTSIDRHHCDGILLATRGDHCCFIPQEAMEHLLDMRPCALWVLHFPAPRLRPWQEWLRNVRIGRASRRSANRRASSMPASPAPQADVQALIPLLEVEQSERSSSTSEESSEMSEIRTLPTSPEGKGARV